MNCFKHTKYNFNFFFSDPLEKKVYFCQIKKANWLSHKFEKGNTHKASKVKEISERLKNKYFIVFLCRSAKKTMMMKQEANFG